MTLEPGRYIITSVAVPGSIGRNLAEDLSFAPKAVLLQSDEILPPIVSVPVSGAFSTCVYRDHI